MMTPADKRRAITKACLYWQDKLKLQNWQVKQCWKNKLDKADPKTVAYVKTDPIYRRAKIYWHLPAITTDIYSQIDNYALHECLHIVSAENDWLIDDYVSAYPNNLRCKTRENLTEHLTMIIWEYEQEARKRK